MPNATINLEVDEKSYEDIREKLFSLYALANDVSTKVMLTTQIIERVSWKYAMTSITVLCLTFVVGFVIGWALHP